MPPDPHRRVARRADAAGRVINRTAMAAGIVGMLAFVTNSLLDVSHALPAVPAYELETSALGVIGL